MEDYDRYYVTHDIPNHPTLFIRDGDFVFVVNKHTGEISEKLTLTEYVDCWRNEWDTNPVFKAYYMKGYFLPKTDPDTATTLKDLKRMCSDSTRHRKGDTGYLLDFIMTDQCSKTESKLFLYLCKNVVVWNYSVTTMEDIQECLGLKSLKQTKAVWKALQDKGLIFLLNSDFEVEGQYKILIKLHPKIYWEGRHSAWAAKCKEEYEYEDSVTID